MNNIVEIFENPINVISLCNHLGEKRLNKILITQTENTKDIYFPSRKYFKNHESKVIKNAISIIEKYLENEYLSGSDNGTNTTLAKDLKWLEENKMRIINELMSDTKLDKTENSVKNLLGIRDGIMTKYELNKKIRFAAFIYCYNQLPFDLNLFYPDNIRDTKFENLSVLMIGKQVGVTVSDSMDSLYRSLITSCQKIPKLENNVQEKISNNILLQITWEDIYKKRYFNYESLSQVIVNICNHLCKEHNIKAEVTSRIKTFPSFYNKLFKRANERVKTDDGFNYTDIIEDPILYTNQVFKHVRDIAGVRIICVYNDDVMKLANIFRDMSKDDLDCSKFRDMSQNRVPNDNSEHVKTRYNYRAFHLTAKPGNKRLDLIEYNGLYDFQCEIQIRTILAHGWSDVQHPMEYKSSIPLAEISSSTSEKVNVKLESISKVLKEQDEEIAKLKNEVDKLHLPMDK